METIYRPNSFGNWSVNGLQMVGKLIKKKFFLVGFGRNLVGKWSQFFLVALYIYIHIKITKQKKSTIVHAYYIKRVKNILKQAN